MGRNWAIAIGINIYENLSSLKYAKRDAEAMVAWFGQEAKFDEVFLFTEDSPPIDKTNPPIPTTPTYGHLRRFLRAQFENIERPLLKPEDNLWFFFAGHGMRNRDKDYLMLCDSDPGDVEHTALSVEYVTQRLRRSGADNIVLFLDACRAVISAPNQSSVSSEDLTVEEWNEQYNQPFHFGATITSDLANYIATSTYADEPAGEYRKETIPVKSFSPNAFGLYDMHGQVREWCADPWHENYQGAPEDSRVWDEQNKNDNHYQNISDNLAELLKDERERILRGGSWSLNPRFCRSAYRVRVNPDYTDDDVGFRVACGGART